MSDAMVAEGVLIQVEKATSPNEFETIAEVVSWSGPGGQSAVIDVTHLTSVAREKRIGLPDEGQLSMELNFIPNNSVQGRLYTARANRTQLTFKITYTDSPASSDTFDAFVLGFVVNGGVDAKVGASITLEITGAVTRA